MRKFFCIIILFQTTLQAQLDNPFTISGVTFDPELFTFHLTWETDTHGIPDDLQGGISVQYSAPSLMPPDIAVYFSLPTSDTTFMIPDVRFDTVYYIQMWAIHEGAWGEPDSSSTQVIRVSSRIRQPVSFFNPTRSKDTIRALENRIVLWKDQEYPLGIPPHEDTIIAYNPPDSVLKGFSALGTGIRFLHPEPSLPLYIGFVIDKFPSNTVHIFRDSSGLLVPERSTMIDAENTMIYVKTSNLTFPFLALADTSRVKIKVISDTASVIGSDPLFDTVTVSDNAAQLSWSFFSAAGGEIFKSPISSGVIQGRAGSIICEFPYIDGSKSGIRALLTVSDGTFQDTIVLSRRGRRENHDLFTIPEKSITPIFTSTILDSPGIKNCLSTLFTISNGSYDKSVFRLFRWYPHSGNKESANKWVEASPSNLKQFPFKAGDLYWLITNKPTLVNLGKGTTVPLKQDYTIYLKPGPTSITHSVLISAYQTF